MKELTILEELQNLLPALTEEEFAGLEASILKDGCLSPLVVWNDILVDGHHRYEICRKHQIPYAIKNVELENLEDAKLWAWQHQENRRNMTPFVRSELALKFKDIVAAKAKERQRCGQGGILLPSKSAEAKETRQELAEMAGVAPSTLGQVKYITEHADDTTKEKLRRGEKGTSINKEYKRLKSESKSEESVTNSQDSETPEAVPYPPCPNKHVKFVPKTTLKLIPQDTPYVLLANLFTHFRKGFVEDLVYMAVDMLGEKNGKPFVQKIIRELQKRHGK
jgi:ParB-like chromosome segregation protein Spo0J